MEIVLMKNLLVFLLIFFFMVAETSISVSTPKPLSESADRVRSTIVSKASPAKVRSIV